MKIVISGFYGLGNTGDEAILKSIIDNIRSEVDKPQITVLSLSPEETAKTHNVHSIYRGWRHQNKMKIRALRKADVLISGGGGLLQDTYPTKFLFGPLPYYLLVVLLAKLVGTKVMFFSQGIGPVTSKWGKFLMRTLANKADFVTVRDQYSKDYLEKLGVTKPETVVTADIVFGMKPSDDDRLYKSLPLKGDETLAAVSVRPWFTNEEYYEKLAKSLDELIEKRGVTPVFVPMEGKYDVTASEDVKKHMKHSDKTMMLERDATPSQYLNFISKCDITIALRLHALIFSALSNVPHVGISYDKKVESLLNRSGMWPYSFRLEELDSDKLVENAIHLLDNAEDEKSKMAPRVDAMRSDAMENLVLLNKHFGK
ncbi:polysaccharide pyruvyl transferase CsaB [Jeotgalibacillus sp. JSM ZJ347]|uniref:polysaccharide pyruvyl transferase CsaB n=1 Tax=Jeotgalibacillus sp. JSM ZJ347 TaxID=3342117 RepID=UPI0035A965DC